MAKLRIYTFPEKVLATRAVEVERVEKTLHPLADDMLETMYAAPGIGLAANQVGVLKRILVLDTDWKESESQFLEGVEVAAVETSNRKPLVMINPKIVYREGSIIFCEGCLSVPEFTADVKRAEKIRVEYQNLDGLTKTLDAEGLQAICIQHEIDHLDGKLFLDRLSPIKKQLIKKKLIKGKTGD